MGELRQKVEIDNKTLYIRKTNSKETSFRFYLERGDGEILTPQVKKITYEEEHKAFLIQDKIAISEYVTCSISYYIDLDGNIVSLAFTNLNDEYFMLPFQTRREFVYQYEAFKFNFASKIREEMEIKEETKLENCRKFIRVKRKDQNEGRV